MSQRPGTTAARDERYARWCQLRAGTSDQPPLRMADARREMGISDKTARRYEAARRQALGLPSPEHARAIERRDKPRPLRWPT